MFDQLSYATGWHRATAGTPDYYNGCNNADVSVPNNITGWEYAKSGVAYAGFTAVSTTVNPNNREYIETKLIDTLISNIKYLVSFYVSLVDSAGYACNNIGAYFSSTMITTSSWSFLPYIPQIVNTSTNPITNKNGWTLIADTITAVGGELYMTIGNFNDSANSDTVYVGGGPFHNLSYYYIDDVSVQLLHNGQGVNENTFSNSISLSPNPATTILQLSINNWQSEKMKLEIFDVLGKSIRRSEIHTAQEEVNVSDLPSGVYYLKIFGEGKSAVKKFVKM